MILLLIANLDGIPFRLLKYEKGALIFSMYQTIAIAWRLFPPDRPAFDSRTDLHYGVGDAASTVHQPHDFD